MWPLGALLLWVFFLRVQQLLGQGKDLQTIINVLDLTKHIRQSKALYRQFI
jgi:hypothetical protein